MLNQLKKIQRLFFVIAFLFLILPSYTILAQSPFEQDKKDIRLGVRILEPFVIKADEKFNGFSYELWEKISKDQNLNTTEIKVYKSASELLNAVEQNQVDVGISALSITKEREEKVDFTGSMFNSGLTVMVKSTDSTSNSISIFENIKESVLNKDFLILFMIIGLVSFLISNIVYFIEKRKNPEFAKIDNYFEGIKESFWWSSSALFGQQEKNPATKTGRVFGLIWMIFGVLFISFYTAQITSNLTAQRINGSITSYQDLKNKTTGVINGSTGEKFIKEVGFQYKSYNNLQELGTDLKLGMIDAGVYDSPAIEYYIKTNPDKDFTTVGGKFTDENYGIALPSKSELRKNLNLSLLKIQESGEYSELVNKYFGD
ncbi:MAG: transporter substrate-binding domain-containing protein [Patescibacteria group bacterium]